MMAMMLVIIQCLHKTIQSAAIHHLLFTENGKPVFESTMKVTRLKAYIFRTKCNKKIIDVL